MTETTLLKSLTTVKLKINDNILPVSGISMLPLIENGDSVKILKCEKYKKGDIIVAIDSTERLLIHRIVNFKNGMIIMKGDNALSLEKVAPKNCFGRITEIIGQNKNTIMVRRHFTQSLIAFFSQMTNHAVQNGIVNPDNVMKHWSRKIQVFFIKRAEMK